MSSSKTGNTDLRETEVQQPKVTATFWFWIRSRAFSANSGQLEAGIDHHRLELAPEHAARLR